MLGRCQPYQCQFGALFDGQIVFVPVLELVKGDDDGLLDVSIEFVLVVGICTDLSSPCV